MEKDLIVMTMIWEKLLGVSIKLCQTQPFITMTP